MSALGQKRTFAQQIALSALLPKADIDWRLGEVRFVPKARDGELRSLCTEPFRVFRDCLHSDKQRQDDDYANLHAGGVIYGLAIIVAVVFGERYHLSRSLPWAT
jgi:hypothetical protein